MSIQISVFDFDETPFEQRLSEAIAWCYPRARADDPRYSLRTEELRPWLLAPDRGATVFSVLRNRALSLFRSGPDVEDEFTELEGGRLMVYFPDANLCAGAAEQESRGFFDVENTPPWDTWVALGMDRKPVGDSAYQIYLVAWVPSMFVDLAAAGIEANPEKCINWVDQANITALDELLVHPLTARSLIRTSQAPLTIVH